MTRNLIKQIFTTNTLKWNKKINLISKKNEKKTNFYMNFNIKLIIYQNVSL